MLWERHSRRRISIWCRHNLRSQSRNMGIEIHTNRIELGSRPSRLLIQWPSQLWPIIINSWRRLSKYRRVRKHKSQPLRSGNNRASYRTIQPYMEGGISRCSSSRVWIEGINTRYNRDNPNLGSSSLECFRCRGSIIDKLVLLKIFRLRLFGCIS